MKEIVILKYSYGYDNGRGVVPMFILVSKLFGLVTGGLLGSPWLTFEFKSRLTKSLLYNVHCVHTHKIKKRKKVKHVDLLF